MRRSSEIRQGADLLQRPSRLGAAMRFIPPSHALQRALWSVSCSLTGSASLWPWAAVGASTQNQVLLQLREQRPRAHTRCAHSMIGQASSTWRLCRAEGCVSNRGCSDRFSEASLALPRHCKHIRVTNSSQLSTSARTASATEKAERHS